MCLARSMSMAAFRSNSAIFGSPSPRPSERSRLMRSSLVVGILCSSMAGAVLVRTFSFQSWADTTTLGRAEARRRSGRRFRYASSPASAAETGWLAFHVKNLNNRKRSLN